jgi:Leucine-rich repeat (LRR) protein
MTQLPHLQCAYLSRNPLHAASLSRLADLHRLELLSLIGCWLERPPPQLSVLTSLRACYLDYNECGVGDSEHDTQSAFRWVHAGVMTAAAAEAWVAPLTVLSAVHRAWVVSPLACFTLLPLPVNLTSSVTCLLLTLLSSTLSCSTAFLPLPGLEALGLSHQQGLDIWPTALDSLTRLKVLYLGKLLLYRQFSGVA